MKFRVIKNKINTKTKNFQKKNKKWSNYKKIMMS